MLSITYCALHDSSLYHTQYDTTFLQFHLFIDVHRHSCCSWQESYQRTEQCRLQISENRIKSFTLSPTAISGSVFLLTSSSVSKWSLLEILSLQLRCVMQHKLSSSGTICLHLQKMVAVGSSKMLVHFHKTNIVTSQKTVLFFQYISFNTNTGEK